MKTLTEAQKQESLDYLRKAYRDLTSRTYGILACFGERSAKWREHQNLLRLTFRDMCAAADACEVPNTPKSEKE